jgi:type IV secretion system protein VirB6
MMSITTGIVTGLLDQVDQITKTFTFNGYSALVSHFNNEIHLAILIYIAMLGWSVMNGWVEMSVNHLTKYVVKIAIAFSLATHWGFFSLFVYNVLTNAPNELSSVLTGSLSHTFIPSGTSVNEALQNVFDQGMEMGVATWSNGGINAASFYLYALLIWLATLFIVGIALLEFVVAKFGLALLLVLAPIFCLFLLWESTKGLFESWLRYALSFALVPTFVTAGLMLLLALLQTALNTMQTAISHGEYTLVHIAPFLLGAIVGVGLLLKAASMASGIGGGLVVNVMHVAHSFANKADRYSGFNAARQLVKQKAGHISKEFADGRKYRSMNKYQR